MKHTDLTRDAVAALPHRNLVDLVMNLAAAADRTADAYAGVVLTAQARSQHAITPEEILGAIETATSDFQADAVAVATRKRTRAENAAYWSGELAEMLDDRLEDGTPVLAIVFAENPDLARRLRKALTP